VLKQTAVAFVIWVASVGAFSPRPQAVPTPAPAPRAPAAAVQAPQAAAADVSPEATVKRYCVGCHNERTKAGGLALDAVNLNTVGTQTPVLEKMVRKLRAGLMPPSGARRPDEATLNALALHLEQGLDREAAVHPHPGRTPAFHRLNRAEYRNVIRDLLGVDIDASDLLPADDASYGFDNIASSLNISESLLERYLGAAQAVSRAAIGIAPPSPPTSTFNVPPDHLQDDHKEGLPLGTRGGILVRHNFLQDGEYTFKVALWCGITFLEGDCDGSGGFDDPHELEVAIDGNRVKVWTIEPRPFGGRLPEGWEVRVPVPAGTHEVTAAFLQLSSAEEVEGHLARFDKPLWSNVSILLRSIMPYQPAVKSLAITGPINPTGVSETDSRRRIFVCRPDRPSDDQRCAEQILSRLARRAYRSPVGREDVQPLLAFFARGRDEGGSFDAGIELALRRLLMSPKFIFRVERDPAGVAPGTNYAISDLELASRLSFFLWSSIPDDELLEAAERGQLRRPEVIERQVRRMLQDPRAEALTQNFAGQWLLLRNIPAAQPYEWKFPNFDDSLREAMRRETELLFDHVMRTDRPATELLTASYSFLNERLARHYGIPSVTGSDFRRVDYAEDNRRRGLLGQGSVLLITSHPQRTSPVIRGKWILTNILGTPPPEPPPDVPPLPETPPGSRLNVLTARERMAQHRDNPVCAACHTMIDPAGFALEDFDATGRWRTLDDDGQPIDASGVLPDGTKFTGLQEFQAALARHPDRFIRTMTERLLTYALGRGLEPYDMPVVRRIAADAAASGYRSSAVVLGVVKSLPFQMRRAAEAAPATGGQ
jgi:hypothetical protein